jgi:hypothetical protein
MIVLSKPTFDRIMAAVQKVEPMNPPTKGGAGWKDVSSRPHRGAALFPVELATDGGADGDAENPASYTYTVTDYFSGVSLATGVAVSHQRPNGMTLPGLTGIAFWDGETLVLWDTDEQPGTFLGCEEEE